MSRVFNGCKSYTARYEEKDPHLARETKPGRASSCHYAGRDARNKRFATTLQRVEFSYGIKQKLWAMIKYHHKDYSQSYGHSEQSLSNPSSHCTLGWNRKTGIRRFVLLVVTMYFLETDNVYMVRRMSNRVNQYHSFDTHIVNWEDHRQNSYGLPHQLKKVEAISDCLHIKRQSIETFLKYGDVQPQIVVNAKW
jgi:hypothetical protein